MAVIFGSNLRFRAMAILVLAASITGSALASSQDAASAYKARCAVCHGADGKGDTAVGKKMGAHDFTSPEVQKQSDSDLAQIVTKGKNKMPAYEGKLKPEDIKALVGYIRQLGKGR